MIKTIVTGLCGAALLVAFAASADAQFNPSVIGTKIHNWEFNEPDDTPLTGTADSIGSSSWTYDLGYNEGNPNAFPPIDPFQTSWVTDGAFVVRRPGGGHYVNSYAPIDTVALANQKLYLVAEVTWDYLNSTSGADIRFGFHNAQAHPNRTSPNPATQVEAPLPPVTILSEIVVRRFVPGSDPPDQPVIGAWGTAEDGTITVSASNNAISGTGYTDFASTVQPDPVQLVLEIDQVERWGAIHWSINGDPFETLGGLGHTFPLNATWNPNFVRLGALNNFLSGDGTGLRIEDLYVAVGADVPGIEGDHNGDGVVDALDYVVWRKDPDSFGGSAGYDQWRSNFGEGSGSGASIAAVPEPGSMALLALGLALVGLWRRR